MADEARLHALLDLVEQARKEGDTATEAKATAAYKAESAPQLEQKKDTSISRKLALGGRAIGEGVTGAGTFVSDQLLNNPDVSSMIPGSPGALLAPLTRATGMTPVQMMLMAANKIAGKKVLPEAKNVQGLIEQGLTQAGAPTPETSGENLAYAATKGTAAALTGAGAGGIGGAANAVRAVLSGASGGAASEYARQKNVGPGGQFVAGLVGGLAPTAIETGVPLLYQTTKNALRPLTKSGQTQMAANILGSQAINPATAKANLQNAQEIIPGSPRTMGEASQDPGLMALEKGLRNKDMSAFSSTISAQNTAQQQVLSKLAGTQMELDAMKAARGAATDPMREGAFAGTGRANEQIALSQDTVQKRLAALQRKAEALPVDLPLDAPQFKKIEAQYASLQDQMTKLKTGEQIVSTARSSDVSPIIAKIDSILASPAGKRETISTSMKWAKGLIGDETDPASLYEIRKDLQLAQRGKLQPTSPNAPAASVLKFAQGQLGDVIATLDNQIEAAAPGYKAYLARYKEMSIPIDQMKALQEIQKRSQLESMDATTRENFLGPSSFGKSVDAAIAGKLYKGQPSLTADQLEQLKAIRTDLQYGQALNSRLIKPAGSDTFQNLSIAQVLGAGQSTAHPMMKIIAKPLQWLYSAAGTDNSVNDILKSAATDPKLAAQLLSKATPKSVQLFSQQLRMRALTGTLGATAQVAAMRSRWQEDTSSQPLDQAVAQ